MPHILNMYNIYYKLIYAYDAHIFFLRDSGVQYLAANQR